MACNVFFGFLFIWIKFWAIAKTGCVKFCYLTVDMKLMLLESVDQKSVSDATNSVF